MKPTLEVADIFRRHGSTTCLRMAWAQVMTRLGVSCLFLRQHQCEGLGGVFPEAVRAEK